MNWNDRIKTLELAANLLMLMGVLLVIGIAFILQILMKELPCPLCLLQRVGFLLIAYSILLNFRFGFRPSHYAIAILSALFTSFAALRQISLHVIPGTGSYGSSILGLHLYSWSYLISSMTIIITTLLLSVDRQYVKGNHIQREWLPLTHFLYLIVAILLTANIISVLLECGFSSCPDNPTQYELLQFI